MDSGEEDEFVPRFSGEEDEFGSWWVSAKAYAARNGFRATMSGTAEADLPANAGPGVGTDVIAAVERNNHAVYLLTFAMPDRMLLSVFAAGQGDPAWPNQAKAHLMIAYLKRKYDMEEDVDVEADDDEEEDDDDDAMVFSFEEDDVENEEEEEDDNEFICGFDEEEEVDEDEFICVFDEEEEEDEDEFIERLSNTVGVKYSDVVRCENEETGSKEDNEVKEEEADEVFIERLSNMVDLDDLLEARESVESEARDSVESEARESVASVEDLSDRVNIRRSGGTNEALQLNEELHIRRSGGTNEALELQDRNEMSKRVKDSDDEHVQFLFDRGRAADSVVKQRQQVEQQQARESAGIEEKWQSGRCRFEVQVCDSGWALAAAR
jgi:hypothetical protein